MSPNYLPIPVATAQQLAEHFQKDAILILGIDNTHDCLHHTTYGVSPQDKVRIAGLSDTLNQLLTGSKKLADFEDFRTLPAAEAKAEIDRLTSALRQAYVHNQNMHCFVTKGRLNDQLNEQTHVLRKALGIPSQTSPLSPSENPPEHGTAPTTQQ